MGGGGAERQLTYTVMGLRELGWETHVALRSGGANFARLEASGAVVHGLGGRSNYDPRLGRQLWRLVGAIDPSLIQTWLPQMDVLGGVAAWARGVPWILTERSSRLSYPPGVRTWLRTLVARRAAAVVANSDSGLEYWQRRARRLARYVVPNAVPVDEIDRVAAVDHGALGVGQGVPVVLFAGRFGPEKNLEALVAALVRVPAQICGVAVLAGEGPLRPAIARAAHQAGLGQRVVIPGYLPDLWAWMKRAHAFVLVSTFEGRPNVVLEAMACGCPLVVSDIPAHREFLDPETAVLVDPRHPAAIADALLDVLTDRKAAAGRARRARARVVDLGVTFVAREYARVYDKVLAEARA
jgi:glycosyltransferase involved in cell wall biosynthesis